MDEETIFREFFRNKTILVTGAAGTVGRELVSQLIGLEPGEIRLFDNNESELFFLNDEYRETGRVRCYLGDIRDAQKLLNLTKAVDLVFHTAAFKHVILSEYNPFDAVQTNINGVKNIVQAAMANNVGRVIFTSSDKAVNPTNVMGTSKLMGERIITAANIVNNNGPQVFSSVRFGNVLGSRGSVVPIFANQILRGEPVTITDVRMTRFVMTVREAARLVIEGAVLSCGGEVFVTKMPVMRIVDLARTMIEMLAPVAGIEPDAVPVKIIGAKPGEKLYEELMSQEEVARVKELPSMFAILPALRSFYHRIDYRYADMLPNQNITNPYISSSQIPMAVEEINVYMEDNGILDEYFGPNLSRTPDNGRGTTLRLDKAAQGHLHKEPTNGEDASDAGVLRMARAEHGR
ncbi:SDR family NAD(P)-dependent oxidoreductase [Syntrophobacter fumaroxidans]|uniref:Polysaccharide biosynthesis protein CapD n=1 Tax=Syntrophobacter fumaroxidans (strain DSM 10017 / MPOB) TaxID=335543 RepID=A0LKB4_SYNFM|nr:SDR family NAD(P)-dependent oxidoreductase [Syntrophobacter fumaroxidans]ABK17866.1 polysaccharide biosynthesis protein CapD [Syntrophobacter fumaroxidans MPOB]